MAEDEKAKQEVIEAILYDDEYGYGSKLNTFKYAKQINKNVTMDDINKFMNKVSFRNKKGCDNYKSFTVNFPRDEFIVDIAEMRYLNGKYVYVFICIGIFSKYAYGIEMPSKYSNSTAITLRCIK